MTMVTKIAMLFHILKTGMSTQSDDTNEKYCKGNIEYLLDGNYCYSFFFPALRVLLFFPF